MPDALGAAHGPRVQPTASLWWRRLGVACAVALASSAVDSSPAAGAYRAGHPVSCRGVRGERSDVNVFSDLAGIAATSACDAWAVGENSQETLIEHWNGRRWEQVPSPNAHPAGTVTNGLDAVSATSFTNAWAVGATDDFSPSVFNFEHTLVLHWNGRRWSRVPSPNPGRGQNSNRLDAVAAISRHDAWAVGSFTSGRYGTDNTLILHWDGRSWTRMASPTPSGALNLFLTGVTAISRSNAWAVGYYEQVGPRLPDQVRTLIEHWDGTRWAIVPSPDPAGHRRGSASELHAIAANAAGDVWTVGSYRRPGIRPRTLIVRWNGTAWTQVPSANPPGKYPDIQLYGVTVQPSGSAWAVGGFGSRDPEDSGHSGHTLIEYWNGRHWLRVPSPSKAGRRSYSALTAIAAPSAGRPMAIGHWICLSAIAPISERLTAGSWRFVSTPGVSGSIPQYCE